MVINKRKLSDLEQFVEIYWRSCSLLNSLSINITPLRKMFVIILLLHGSLAGCLAGVRAFQMTSNAKAHRDRMMNVKVDALLSLSLHAVDGHCYCDSIYWWTVTQHRFLALIWGHGMGCANMCLSAASLFRSISRYAQDNLITPSNMHAQEATTERRSRKSSVPVMNINKSIVA